MHRNMRIPSNLMCIRNSKADGDDVFTIYFKAFGRPEHYLFNMRVGGVSELRGQRFIDLLSLNYRNLSSF